MKTIPLTQGKVALVDDEDYDWLTQWKWRVWKQHSTGDYYACRTERSAVDSVFSPRVVMMHRMILGLQFGDKLHGDHKNHDTLDNRRENLRIATSSQNQGNSRKHKPKSSTFKGVHWSKKYGKWTATISIDGKQTFLGYRDTPEEAAALYNEAALEAFGEFANPNVLNNIA